MVLASYIRQVILLIDNYDSFTWILNDYFLSLGAETDVRRNDAVSMADLNAYDALIISPGPGTPVDAGITMDAIKYFDGRKPVFGVCLGMQAIGELYGATLERALYPMHGKVSSLKYKQGHPMFTNITGSLDVCRYHSLILKGLESTELETIAETEKGEPMALAHRSKPTWGVQFHPEAILSTEGKEIIKNWLNNFNLH